MEKSYIENHIGLKDTEISISWFPEDIDRLRKLEKIWFDESFWFLELNGMSGFLGKTQPGGSRKNLADGEKRFM